MKWRLAICILLVGFVMGLPIEVPDWHRVITLIGEDEDGDPHILIVDTDGNLVAVMKGNDDGTLRSIAVDGDGQLYTLIKGSGGEDVAVDGAGNLAALMKGVDGVTLRTVAVDGSGNIVAVIKGDYGGVLKSVAVDDQGRMIMIPTDPADIWGNAISMGNAELAAVLSSAKRFDRRGSLVWMDSFDHGFNKWRAYPGAADAEAVLSAIASRTGTYSARLTGCAADPWSVGIQRVFPIPVEGKVGIEVSFTVDSQLDRIEILPVIDDRTEFKRCGVRYNHVDNDFEYYDSGGNWQDIDSSVFPYPAFNTFLTIKLVFDTSADKYVRAILNHEEHDLSAHAIRVTGTVGVENMVLGIYVYSVDGENTVSYIDDVILTQNEPANPE